MGITEKERQGLRRILLALITGGKLMVLLSAYVCLLGPPSICAATTVLYHIVGAQRIRVSTGNSIEFQPAIRNSSGIIYSPEESFVITNEDILADSFLLETGDSTSFIIPNAQCEPWTAPSTICGVLWAQQEFSFTIRYDPSSGIARTVQQFDFNNGRFVIGGVSFDVGADVYYLEANAGPNQQVDAGQIVSLHGAGSFPPTSTFRWNVILWPNGSSQPPITTTTSTNASFLAVSPGLYRARFTVTFNSFTNSDDVDITAIDPSALPYFFTPMISQKGTVQLKLRPTLGRTTYVIEASSDLETWGVVTNIVSADAVIQFSFPIGTNSTHRFFRAVAP